MMPARHRPDDPLEPPGASLGLLLGVQKELGAKFTG